MVMALIAGIFAPVTIIVASTLGRVTGVIDVVIVSGVLGFVGAIFAFIWPLAILWPLVAG